MVIDIHTHLWDSAAQLGPGTFRRLLLGRESQPWDRPAVTSEALAEASACVDKVVVHGFTSRLLGVSITSGQVARWVADEPARRIGFAGIDPLADDWVDELARAADLGLSGVTISPAAQGYLPTDYRAHALFAAAAKRKLPVMVLPGLQLNPQADIAHARPEHFDEVGRQFPELPIVLAQAGYPWIDATLTLLSKHKRMYASVSGLTSRPWLLYQTLLSAHELGVADKLLFGSDFPFALPAEAIAAVYATAALVRGTPLPGVARDVLEGVVRADALGCLGITAAIKAVAISPSLT